MLKVIQEALTFDDVLLVPDASNILPSQALLKTQLTSKIQLNYKLVERRAGDIASLYASTQHTESTLGWKANHGIDEMMRSAWEWEQYYRGKK